MRCQTAARAKAKNGRCTGPRVLQEKPREGSRIRAVYDLLYASKGKAVEVESTGSMLGIIMTQLENFYGLDIRHLRNGSSRVGRKSTYVLAGEWFGRVYVDYIAEHLSSLSQHSSDGEQPLCRRKRADSSPAAGTISSVTVMTHTMARALCEAGYMPLTEYLRLCELNGWVKA